MLEFLTRKKTEAKPPTKKIEGSARYYQTKEMHLFASAVVAYKFVLENVVKRANEAFTAVKPSDVSILGGFFPNRRNIDEFDKLSAGISVPTEQVRYFDFNAEPASILTDEERQRFHQMNLKDIATATGEDAEPIVKPETVKMIALDHVTEFMDEATIEEFFKGLSTVLAPDGVALMAVVKVKNKLWHRFRAKMIMGVENHPRTIEEWQQLAKKHLKVSMKVQYPIDNRRGVMFVLTRQDSPYPENTGTIELERDDLLLFDLQQQRKTTQLDSTPIAVENTAT